jgi:quinol monooxygenase YgiN
MTVADEPAGVVKLVARPGRDQELAQLLSAMARAAAGDDGTEIYAVHRERKDPTAFFLYELYRDKDAFARHRANPELAELGRGLAELTTSIEIVTGNLIAGDRAQRSR